MVLKMPESGLAKVKSGTHRPLLLTSETVPDDGKRLHNRQVIAGRLPACGVECDAEDLDCELVGGSRDCEHIIKIAAKLATDVGDELKTVAVVEDVASSRKVSYQMDDIDGYSFNPPDGPTQLDIEMLPLDGLAVEPVVYVSGILLISHEFNALRLHEFQYNVLIMC
jgi:hypothetical protein